MYIKTVTTIEFTHAEQTALNQVQKLLNDAYKNTTGSIEKAAEKALLSLTDFLDVTHMAGC